MKTKFLSSFVFDLYFVFFLTTFANAAPPVTIIERKISVSDFVHLVDNIFEWILSIGGAVALFMLIYGGIMYMNSTGDEQKATKAKKIVYWALGGLMLLLLAYSISFTINKIFT